MAVRKELTTDWVKRSVIVAAGMIPFALWFVYVIKNDPVFQARAATETFSPNFRAVVFGLLLFLPGLAILKGKADRLALVAFGIVVVSMFIGAVAHTSGYFLPLPIWAITMFATWAACSQIKTLNAPATLVVCWAMVGLIAPYFPALFERKLLMMIGIPWGIMAGLVLAPVLARRPANEKRLIGAFVTILISASSIRWVGREVDLLKRNVSNTTMHTVFLSDDTEKILAQLKPLGRDAVVAALPGVWNPKKGSPGEFESPLLTDLNSVFVGLNGNRAYAGHWSETPEYGKRRSSMAKLLEQGDQEGLKLIGVTHAVVPTQFAKATLGTEMFKGTQFTLYKMN